MEPWWWENMVTQTWCLKKEASKSATSMDAFSQEPVSISYQTARSLTSSDYLMITERSAAKRWILQKQGELLSSLKTWKTRKCSDNFRIWNKLKNRSSSLSNLHRERNSWSFHQLGTTTWATMKQPPTYLWKSSRRSIYWRSSSSTSESERNIPPRLHSPKSSWRWERRFKSLCILKDMRKLKSWTCNAILRNSRRETAKKSKLIRLLTNRRLD